MTEKLAVIIIVILIVMLVVAVLMIRRYGMKSRVALFGVGLPLLMFFVIMAMSAFRTPMWMDEYVFYRLSSDLPHYSTTSDWFYVDRPDVLNPSVTWEDKSSVVIDKRASFDWIYNNPVYLHDPLAPALVYPLVKTLNVMADKGIIQHIEAQPGYASVSKTLTSDEKNKVRNLFFDALYKYSKKLKKAKNGWISNSHSAEMKPLRGPHLGVAN